jgi:DNA excision repair protein ERCC-2
VAVYYSSFALMKGIADRVDVPGRDTLMQVPRMPENERRDLVDRLRQFGAPRVLHAVLGGIFAEGIDLPGGILKTIVLVGPALPMVGLERDLMRAWYEERYGDGFGYAFLVPGMSKVVQAAGRVVRGPTERGCVVLMGKRFASRDYSRFFPDYWTATQSQDPAVQVREFWEHE